jgi:hypothetical protein
MTAAENTDLIRLAFLVVVDDKAKVASGVLLAVLKVPVNL